MRFCIVGIHFTGVTIRLFVITITIKSGCSLVMIGSDKLKRKKSIVGMFMLCFTRRCNSDCHLFLLIILLDCIERKKYLIKSMMVILGS